MQKCFAVKEICTTFALANKAIMVKLFCNAVEETKAKKRDGPFVYRLGREIFIL